MRTAGWRWAIFATLGASGGVAVAELASWVTTPGSSSTDQDTGHVGDDDDDDDTGDEFPPRCIADEDEASLRCEVLDAGTGDFELYAEDGHVLLVTNLGADEEPYPEVGTWWVKLYDLDCASKEVLGSRQLAADYSGDPTLNGPEFIVPPPSTGDDLGVLYHTPQGVKACWRRQGARRLDFRPCEELPSTPDQGYPGVQYPERTGGYTVIAVPPESADYAACPDACFQRIEGGPILPALELMRQDGLVVSSMAAHPVSADRWGATVCDGATQACGLLVGTSSDGVWDRSRDLLAPTFQPETEWETLRGGIHPVTGKVLWFAGDARHRIHVYLEGETALTEITSPDYRAGNGPIPGAGLLNHFHVQRAPGRLVVYYQVRPRSGLSEDQVGSYVLTVGFDGSGYTLTGPVRFSTCAFGTELLWLDCLGRWGSYEVSDDVEGDPHVYRCLVTDADGDGVDDAGEACFGASEADADQDGLCNEQDPCVGTSQQDADRDGVCDERDACAGEDDDADADQDGVPDACDRCARGPDGADDDGDAVPDACDRCPTGPDDADQDRDGVPDACDRCPTGPDSDDDGVCDPVDLCLGDDATGDTDGDAVCDNRDLCVGHDGLGDPDGDGVCGSPPEPPTPEPEPHGTPTTSPCGCGTAGPLGGWWPWTAAAVLGRRQRRRPRVR